MVPIRVAFIGCNVSPLIGGGRPKLLGAAAACRVGSLSGARVAGNSSPPIAGSFAIPEGEENGLQRHDGRAIESSPVRFSWFAIKPADAAVS